MVAPGVFVAIYSPMVIDDDRFAFCMVN